ncbi:MAG: acriflavine resistance protein B [marine bacterium B5-7]|nr:MAG: acriflavine resistance protein B [marine bacterium B5-7]
MAKFTDIYIKRPVLASVISLLILLLGFKSLSSLGVRQYPKMENTVIQVNTSYPGASAALVQGFITTQIEQSVASADGIDYLTSSSTQGSSSISAYIKLGFDPDKAFTDIMSKVASVTNNLPKASEQPVIEKNTGSQIALMYIGFSSKDLSQAQVNDYLVRVVQPKLETVEGVSEADILGSHQFAMRIWLNPQRMAALGVNPQEVNDALLKNNFQSAAGETKGMYVAYNIRASTDLHTAKEFQQIVVKQNNGTLVRLQDVAKVELGASSYSSNVRFNGKNGVFVAITAVPSANPLSVINRVLKLYPKIKDHLPDSISSSIGYDATTYIRDSIHEVMTTILEAALIVILVIFMFLGSFRSVLIPVVTIPLSLIGVCTLMLALNYTLNLLTLLAMVLAIGLVVDDAIVVVENVYRHIEEGHKPYEAALLGAREIAVPVISMTITLAAVYAPIGFMGGITGILFKEFAFTLALSVIISGIIALTLSPMLCSKLLSHEIGEGKLVKLIDSTFARLRARYEKVLAGTLACRPAIVLMAIVVICSCFFLFANTKSEMAPQEDEGALFFLGTGPQYANISYTSAFTEQIHKIIRSFKETDQDFIVAGSNGANTSFGGMILKPWSQRKRTAMQIFPEFKNKLNAVSGLQTIAIQPPSLPVSGSAVPIQVVIHATDGYKPMYEYSQKLMQAAQASGKFLFIQNSLMYNQPQIDIAIDRAKVALMGLNMQSVGAALANSLGGNYTNWFSIAGRSYKVIQQVPRLYRMTPEKLKHIYVKADNGNMVPLSTVVHLSHSVQPNNLSRFQQLNSATLQGAPMPGISLGEAIKFLQDKAADILPNSYSVGYAGQTRQYIQEGNALMITFFFAIIIIFLVLAAQFESYRDPFIVLITVPMSICGALIPLNLGAATINIYTQIGLVTLIGLISKHGILLVEFANQLQVEENLSPMEAIKKSAAIRLRPVLMTTAAMILGVFPLIIATGAGAVSRFDIGIVIASGMAIGTCFTLFVVPTMYSLIASDKRQTAPAVDVSE